MLTRFRQLYNRLTHSQAFKDEGPVDNSKINKKTFTPHNLKAILLGVNGAVAVHYTTNGVDTKLVSLIPLKNGVEGMAVSQNEKWYRKNLEEDKGLIDAVWFSDGLKFNYIEEIVFFTGGFTEEELTKENRRINLFAKNDKVINSMKRLKGIIRVDATLTSEFEKIDPKKSVLKSLDLMGMPFEPIIKFSPEKTELGLLVNRGLDSKEYELDSQYSETLPENEKGKEKYRLSRYFYEEVKRAEQARKAQEEAAKKAALEISNAEMDSFLNELWGDVRPIYEELYRNSIENNLIGILVPTGFIGYDYNKKSLYTNNNVWVKNMAESFLTLGGDGLIKSTRRFKDLELKDLVEYNYFSEFHALNAFGLKDDGSRTRQWDTMLPIIEERFKKIAKAFLSQADKKNITDLYNEIQKKLTNCIVIERFDRNTIISLKYKVDGIDIGYNKFFEEHCTELVGKQNCKILNSVVSQNNVNTMFGVFDAKKFAAEALFSYQAYEDLIKADKKPSLQNTVIGRNLDGTKSIYSLKSNDARLTAIFAGSGSGKGVMTLGLLSSIVANKVPFIYLDYKPDMAEMLWNIEKDFKARGITRTDGSECRILAIDAKADITECSPVRGHRFGENLPEYMAEIPSTVFAVLPYLKLMQLYFLLASIRKNESNKPDFGGSMTYAIFDELQQNVIDNLSNLQNTLLSFEKTAKKMKKPSAAEITVYKNKIDDYIEKLANSTGTFVNTDGRVANSRALYIGQNANYSVWVKDARASTIEGNLYQKTSFRFFGRNGGTGSYAPTNGGAIKEFVNNPETFGYWTSAVGAGPVDKITDWKVFKAYSVLNENDFNMADPSASGRCTAGVLGNIQDETVREDLVNNVFVMDDGTGNKVIRPEVGFLGLIKKLSGFSDNELADALSEGYEVIWKVMCKFGMNNIYPDVETYLFDASLESIYTTDEIKRGFSAKADSQPAYDNFKVFGDDTPATEDDDDVVLEDLTAPATPSDSEKTTQDTPQPIHSAAPKNEEVETSQSKPQPIISQPRVDSQWQPISPQPIPSPSVAQPNHSWSDQRRKEIMKKGQCYTGKLRIDNNPFDIYRSGSKTDTLLSVKEMTKILKEDIAKHIGSPDLITSFVISGGVLYFNDIAYIPEFDEHFIQSLPLVYQEKVRAGILSDFLDLRTVYKFKNLTSFSLKDWSLAQGRARKEMGIGFRKKWNILFRKFKYLNYIEIGQGNSIVYERDYPDNNAENSILEKFKNNPETTYSSSKTAGMLDKVWDSRPVRVVTGALGWTAGVQVVWLLASIMGPWGLLFGGLAVAGAYKELKNNSQGQYRIEAPKQNTKSKSKKKSSNKGFSNTYD